MAIRGSDVTDRERVKGAACCLLLLLTLVTQYEQNGASYGRKPLIGWAKGNSENL